MKNVFILILIILFLGICYVLGEPAIKPESKTIITKPTPISEKIIEKLSTTKTIIVKKIIFEENIESTIPIKTITDANEIKEIISTISHAKKITGDVNYIGRSHDFEMYDTDGKLIDIVEIYDVNIGLKSNKYRYSLDIDALMKVIEG